VKRIVIVVLALAGFGAAKMKFEQQLADEHRAAFFRGADLNLDLRQQIGQLGFLAALSGFRSLVADVLWIEAHTAWQRTEWGRMALLMDAVTALQPRATLFWDIAAWHMAWNASVAALEDPRLGREALRIKAQREYFEMGRDFLIRGIQNNPDKPMLYERLGDLYRDKFRDHCAAAKQYALAARFPDARHYVKRFAAYELAQCPGHEREAYEKMVELYLRGEEERTPSLLKFLRELAEKLHVPAHQRVYNGTP
jgi:hypothetical protein